ncbi:MAG: DUF4286 family protein [Chitinophagaceae bacterium]|nr:DUF4286 family protein [Chitinophagaceae bacterium]
MIVYNITMQVSWAVHVAWRQWLADEYLPAILATGLFTHYQLVRVMEVDEEEGATYAMQLYSSDIQTFREFRNSHLPGLQNIERNLWGDNVFSFNSLMEVIN